LSSVVSEWNTLKSDVEKANRELIQADEAVSHLQKQVQALKMQHH
jgi:hypothetical protein